MILLEDQENLFRLISNIVQKDLECYAFGGNAMMFYGYKKGTKDVDLLFEEERERKEFSRALIFLGYAESSPVTIYISEKLRDPHRPLMLKREDSRFDLFVKKIFQTLLSPRMKEDFYAIHEFKGKHTIRVKVLRKEHIVLLKAVTDRQNDFDDIRLIIEQDRRLDWQYFIDEVVWQFQHGGGWVLSDVEKMMKELKQYVFIEEKYFQQLYAAKSGEK